jgi:hypothetical protein
VTTALTCGVAVAASASVAQQDAAAEVAEESAEGAEDAAAAPFDLAVAQTHHRYLARIEYLKGLIHRLRAEMKIVRALPHTTTRYLVHLPKKHERIKMYRARIRELRAKAAASAAGG